MSVPKQKIREIIYQIIFSLDMSSALEEEIIPLIMQELTVSKKVVREAREQALLIWQKRDEIDVLIEQTSKAYEFERIQRAERNVLRLAVYEMLIEATIAPKIAIAEAIRLCRKFSTPESSAFVNAILDALYQKTVDPVPSSNE